MYWLGTIYELTGETSTALKTYKQGKSRMCEAAILRLGCDIAHQRFVAQLVHERLRVLVQPFRHLGVYPPLMREIEREWRARTGGPTPAHAYLS